MKSPLSALPLPQVYFEDEANRYWLNQGRGRFRCLPASDVNMWLIDAGFDDRRHKGGGLSEVQKARLALQDKNRVDAAISLAGYSSGVHDSGNLRVLVPSGPLIIAPQEGTWPTLDTLLRNMLGEEHRQREILLAWLKRGYESLRSGDFTPGQALCLAGPQNSGKTLLQLIITDILGGRSARAHSFLNSGTTFNRDLFEAEHLMIDDDMASTDIRVRRNFGATLKNVAVSPTQRFHAKGKDARTVRPFWRLSISVNDNPEDLMVLPPLDDSITDKLILIRVRQAPMPMPTDTPEQQAALLDTLRGELPAFLQHLVTWTVSPEISDSRYGVSSFQHPDIVELLTEMQPEERLLRIIDHVRFADHLTPPPTGGGHFVRALRGNWDGTAEELEADLRRHNKFGSEAEKLFTWSAACGTFLGRLAGRDNPRVTSRKINGRTYWTIYPPVIAAEPELNQQ